MNIDETDTKKETPPDRHEPGIQDVVKVDLQAASDKFTLTTVAIPLTYNDQILSVLSLLDRNTLLCGLSDNGEDIYEIGIWQIDLSKYTKLLDVDAGSWYTIASNEEYIFFEYLSEFNDMGIMSKIAQLWMYNLQNGDFEKIFDYSQDSDGYNGAVFSNHRVLHDGYWYFEDLLKNEGQQWVGTAYRYNLKTGQIEALGDNLQDELLLNGAVWYLQIDSDGSQPRLKNITSGETMEIPENIYDYVSTGNDIAARYSIGENADNGLPVMELKLIDSETTIFSGEYNIDKLKANEYFTVWTNLVDEYPMLYDNVHNQMLYLESMDKAEHLYWLKDNYGLILSMIHHQDGTVEYNIPYRAKRAHA